MSSKLAILIHAHTKPNQLARLVASLQHRQVDIYINIDGKVDISEFKQNIKGAYFLMNRVEVFWGRFSQLEQILNSFQEILETKHSYSHILFISGLDYPAKSISYIINFLNDNKEKSFIDYHELKNDSWSNLMKKRYQYWHFLPKYDLRNNRIVKKILLKIGFKRKYPFAKVYYGSCWFCLSINCVEYILSYTKTHTKILDFFRYAGCSDELYIQSVLINSPIKDNMINNIHRYFDWADKGKSPKILTKSDYDKIIASGAWFARKLDQDTDAELFDMLDYTIKNDD